MSGLDFSTVIASTVHDMKNSLAMLGQAHAQWLAQLPPELQGGTQRGVIEYEFARLNGMLVQLLGLYKLGVNQLPMRPGYHEVEDFLQAQLARHDEVLRSRGIGSGPQHELPDELFERLGLTRDKAEDALDKVLQAEAALRELASQFNHPH